MRRPARRHVLCARRRGVVARLGAARPEPRLFELLRCRLPLHGAVGVRGRLDARPPARADAGQRWQASWKTHSGTSSTVTGHPVHRTGIRGGATQHQHALERRRRPAQPNFGIERVPPPQRRACANSQYQGSPRAASASARTRRTRAARASRRRRRRPRRPRPTRRPSRRRSSSRSTCCRSTRARAPAAGATGTGTGTPRAARASTRAARTWRSSRCSTTPITPTTAPMPTAASPRPPRSSAGPRGTATTSASAAAP